jgi:hypothetical protein
MFGFKGVTLGARERIAGSVYGTIVVLAVLADGASAYEHDLWKLDALVLATVLILWIAHLMPTDSERASGSGGDSPVESFRRSSVTS